MSGGASASGASPVDCDARPWVVLKYGGTSVASASTWQAIAKRARELVAGGARVWIVVSALSGVTNALLRALDEALQRSGPVYTAFEWIVTAHARLASAMGVSGAAEYEPVAALLDDLKRLLDGIVLTQEVSPKLRARVAAFGELLSSQLGVGYLRAQLSGGGVIAARVDSRLLLTSDDGVASCLDPATGARLWTARAGGHYSGSPFSAGGLVYFTDDVGVTKVVRPGPAFDVIAENDLGEECYASPAVSDGRIFFRTAGHLVCIGGGTGATP